MAAGCKLHPITGTMSCAACRDKLATGFAEYFAPKPTREQLRQLCEREGYGAIAHLTERLWAKKCLELGQPGAEHTRGPCASFMVPCSCVHGAEDDGTQCWPCEWCCGVGRVTKRVAEAQADSRDAAWYLAEAAAPFVVSTPETAVADVRAAIAAVASNTDTETSETHGSRVHEVTSSKPGGGSAEPGSLSESRRSGSGVQTAIAGAARERDASYASDVTGGLSSDRVSVRCVCGRIARSLKRGPENRLKQFERTRDDRREGDDILIDEQTRRVPANASGVPACAECRAYGHGTACIRCASGEG